MTDMDKNLQVPERLRKITLTISSFLFQFTIYAHDSTIGQQILNLKYSGSEGQSSWMSRRQKILYGLILIVCPWLRERAETLASFVGLTNYQVKV